MLAAAKTQLPAIYAALAISFLVLFYVSSIHSHANQLQATIDILRTSAAEKPSSIAGLTKEKTLSSGPNRDLIMYAYHETQEAAVNFEFFRRHALHGKADFILMLNGPHNVDLSMVAHLPNVYVVERENRCLDLGGFHEILTANSTLTTSYKRFMFLNSSLRGPFFPPWADKICWSDAYWDKLDARTKLVGMSWNCANNIPYPPHLQSMVLAFTQETLLQTLLPSMKCYEDMASAITDGETKMASRVMDAGGDVYAMESRFAAHAGPSGKDTAAFLEWCVDKEGSDAVSGGDDIHHTGTYEGTTIHPYESIFVKTNRDWDERDRRVIDLLSEHSNVEGYSSFDHCL